MSSMRSTLLHAACASIIAPLAANTAMLAVAFAVIVLISALGLSVIAGLLRWLVGRHDLKWHASVYLALCLGPILILEAVKLLCGSRVLLSVIQQITLATAASQILFAPYFVFFCFALLARLSPLYRQRLAGCFAKDVPVPGLTTDGD